MTVPRPALVAARAAFVLFFLATSSYALLAFIPFTYLQFLRHDLVPWVSAFARWHHLLYWPAAALGALTLLSPAHPRGAGPDPLRQRDIAGAFVESRRSGEKRGARRAAGAFVVLAAAAGAVLLMRPVLPGLSPGPLSAAVILAALIPILAMAAIDVASGWGSIIWSAAGTAEDRRLFRASLLAAGGVTILYALVALARARDGAGTSPWAGMRPGEAISVLLWSALVHLAAFAALFVLLSLVRGLAAFAARPARAELWMGAILLGTGVALVWRRLVFASLSFGGARATLFAAATGLAVAGALAGLGLRLRRVEGANVSSGLEVLLAPLGPPPGASWPARAIWIAGALVAALVLGTAAGRQDWNFLLQKLIALAVSLLTFGTLYCWLRERSVEPAARGRIVPARPEIPPPSTAGRDDRSLPAHHDHGLAAPPRRAGRGRPARYVLAAAAVALAYRGVHDGARAVPTASTIATAVGVSPEAVAAGIDRYAGYEASFRLLRDALAPGALEDPGFYRFLERHTNIARDIPIAPVDVDLVPDLAPSPGRKPSILLIVIDSLRPDYLSPYNPSVGFTPAIGRFASESVVFTSAFTHYGATGLSQPSIWVGGLLPHKQYVTPFAPMNALEKLLRVEGYTMLLSMDSILRTIVSPSPRLVDLERGIPNRDGGLCRTLASLREALAAAPPGGPPIFVYVQPQDIHVSVITRQKGAVPPGETYPGFHAPYASRIRGMDACFGELIEDLKRSGRYDDWIVVLTSDHGDLLGEGGRWGHAYTLTPEIVRVPLIVHLPRALAGGLAFEPDGLVFTTDITPTLYALLGHPPVLRGSFRPAPVHADEIGASRPGLEDHLLASSYGPVYGILSGGGRSLYVVDGINYTDELFELGPGGGARVLPVGPSLRREMARRIRDKVEEIDRYYRVTGLD